ncbi:MAG: YlmC/YmxH family sporulation protein [Firmicutes bacterium]|nr:YlmC/YmxH family sporulation protein [Bacillota bacterium]
MNEFGTMSFCELRQKEVVNVLDGRRLGRIIDLIFCPGPGGEVKGIVIPYARRFFFSRAQDVFVPMSCIRKIGEDVILIELILESGAREYKKGGRRRYDEFLDGRRFDGREERGEERYGERGGEERHGERDRGGYGGVHVNAVPPREPERDYQKPHFDVHATTQKKKEKEPPPPEGPRCDRKCEKCMLFDCAYRWKDM